MFERLERTSIRFSLCSQSRHGKQCHPASTTSNAVSGNGTAGGIEFNRVTFDASGASLSGTQVAAGSWTIGTTSNRVQGDGPRFDGPTGNLAFGTLNIANYNGTGLCVDTKTLGTTFSLSNTGGTIDTTNGTATYLDPLTADLTFGTVNSTGSSTYGMDAGGGDQVRSP